VLRGIAVVAAALLLPCAAQAASAVQDGRIAYVRNESLTSPVTSLWTIDADGTGRRRILGQANDPAFSPSGRRVVFKRGDALFGAHADGSHVRQLTHPDYTDFLPSYSRDGRLVAFQRGYDYGEDPGYSWIYVMRSDGTHARRLTPDRVIAWDPRIAPDGEQVLWSTSRRAGDGDQFDLMAIDVDGAHRRLLTSTAHADERGAEFSPRGRRIVFARITGAGTEHENSDIYVMNRDGSHVRRLTATPDAYEEHPQFSPDGRHILFETSAHDGGTFHPFDVAVMRGDGSDRRRLTSSDDDEYHPHYSPTGERVVYTRCHRHQADVFTVPAEGGSRRNVTASPRSESAVGWLRAGADPSR
jgi:Tol biopolymer transport system component